MAPICRGCDQPGVHASTEDCLAALRAARELYAPRPAVVMEDQPPERRLDAVPEPPPISDEFVTILEACALAKVCRRTIYNWLEDGKLRTIRTAGGARRIRAESLFRSA